MQVAILFWIYKNVDVCFNRAQLLRKQNPQLKIYGLFGGEHKDAALFEESLKPYLDDFYVYPEDKSSEWKWLHGDLMLVKWFEQRGCSLPWDTILIAQWDMVMLAPVSQLLSSLKFDQLMLPGLRPISDVENWWYWVRKDSNVRSDYEKFCSALVEQFPSSPLCCNFITAALPRRFLERYQHIEQPEIGFLEYKIPIYAQIWGFSFCIDHPFNPAWLHEKHHNRIERALLTFHAEKRPIYTWTLLLNALLPWGKRVFHPYTKLLPQLLRG
ncbi:MAG: hypothetical protein WAO98_03860 [Alphaproteobacteria bacterium]